VIPFLYADEDLDRPYTRDVEYKLPCRFFLSKGVKCVADWYFIRHPQELAQIMDGLPSHIQLIGNPLQDEELIRIVEYIDKILMNG
jgi:hypothetical protein